MSRQNIVAGIDIGNTNIKTIIAEVNPQTLRPQVLGVGTSPSNGLRRGMVKDMNETVSDVRNSVKQAESMSGVKIRQAYVSINGLHIKNQVSRGVVAVSRADNEISQNDINRVVEAASTVSLPPNREKIHIIPQNFIIDGQENVKNPIGMKGVRIEADVLIIEGLSPYIHNLAKCINENGIEVVEFVYSPLAVAKSVLDKNQKEHGVLSLDFGGGVSSISLFQEGELIYTKVLPIGSRHITHDLAVALRSSIDIAEKTKIKFGSILKEKIGKKQTIDLSELTDEEDFVISKKYIADAVEARVSELFDMILNELKKVNNVSTIPAGLVLSGGGSNLPGLVTFAKNKLNLPVKIGEYWSFDGMLDQANDPSFSVAAGLILWGIEKKFSDGKMNNYNAIRVNNFFKDIGDWLKNFLP